MKKPTYAQFLAESRKKRAKIMALVAQGLSDYKIAPMLGITAQRVGQVRRSEQLR